MDSPPEQGTTPLAVIGGDAACGLDQEPAWIRRAVGLGWCPPEALWLAQHFSAMVALETLLTADAVQQLPHDLRHALVVAAAEVAGEPVVGCTCRPAPGQSTLW